MTIPATEPSEPLPDAASPTQVVLDFFAAMSRREPTAAIELVHPDIVYMNVGWPTLRGKKSTARLLAKFAGPLSLNVKMVNVCSDGNIVLTERVDEMSIGRLHWQFWVCGRLEIRDGQVIVWRDYFDHLHAAGTLLRAVAAAVIPALQRPLALPPTWTGSAG